jgi:pimeloyl-ACP methyl ester carboxylesterase
MAFVVASDGVKLFYETVGSGPPLVLQTGGAGDGTMWRDAGYVEALAAHHRCLLFDHRGHGRSDQPPLAASHTMARYAADVVELLDHAGIDRAAFWGYSQGGEIGRAIAFLYPERVTALITTGVIGNPDRGVNADEIREAIDGIGHQGWDAIVDPAALALAPAWFKHQVQSTNPHMLSLWFEAYGGWDPCILLPRIPAPILMFVGELEDPDDWNSRAAQLAGNARVVRLPGLDHLQAFIRSDLVVPEAMQFLSTTIRNSGLNTRVK